MYLLNTIPEVKTSKMKVTLAILFVTLIGYVCSEPCGNTQECERHHLTHCHMHTHIVCNSGQCECSSGPTGIACTQFSDCSSVTCRDNNDNAHCVDGHCQCTRRPGGQGGN
ncbi:integrin beta-5-like [Ruditapes philippinarum]|uniref:integrin beta-5-like n=1 Tax=Ruditapes philippinarum TaxID=129788 RepID=UPI00295C1074|nr:integrin beta-5-like [Ruditapes philippinarum]